MRTEKDGSARLDRRHLLKGAGLVIGAASASSAIACEKTVSVSKAKPQHAGYRESEQVKTYYRLARS
jgi:hypothetical protein